MKTKGAFGRSPVVPGKVTRWMEKNCRFDNQSSTQGFYNSKYDKFTIDINECWADPSVNYLALMCSAQSYKTQSATFALMYSLAHDPQNTMVAFPNQDLANEYMTSRFKSTVERCDSVDRLVLDSRFAFTKDEAYVAGKTLYFKGSGSDANLCSRPVGQVYIDELKDMDPRSLEKVITRTSSFWYWKAILTSTPKHDNDAAHIAYLEGNQMHYHCCCPKCGEKFPLRFFKPDNEAKGGLEWDKKPTIDEEDATLRYECHNPNCDYVCRDDMEERYQLTCNDGCEWVATNPNAPSGYVSKHWNALLPSWRSWKVIKHRYQKAKRAKDRGNPALMKEVYNEVFGLPYSEASTAETVFLAPSKYSISDYTDGHMWDGAIDRFMTVDCQLDHFYVVIRDWAGESKSRLVYREKGVDTIEDLIRLQEKYGVRERHVILDLGNDTYNLGAHVVRNNWLGMMGSKTRTFPWKIKKNGKAEWVDKYVSKLNSLKTSNGKCNYIHYSNGHIKDILDGLRSAKETDGDGNEHNELWQIPDDVGPDYLAQMDAEAKIEVVNGDTGKTSWEWKPRKSKIDNHYWDCECMQVAAAYYKNRL